MTELNTDTCDLSGLNIVEAGAGTGKTYSIQKLVLRLVLEKEIPLPKVLVVTFTEAATGELTDRLHAILQLTQEALDAAEAGKDIFSNKRYEQIHGILRNQRIEDIDNRKRCRRLIQDALCDYDQTAVMTIHGFCQRMLQTNAFLSFVRYGVEVRPDISELENKIAMDFCRMLFYDDNSPYAAAPTPPEELLADARDAIANAYNSANILWPDDTDLLNRIMDPDLWSPANCPLFANVKLKADGKKVLAKLGVRELPDLAGKIADAVSAGNSRFVWSVCLVLDRLYKDAENNFAQKSLAALGAYSIFFKVMRAVAVAVIHQFFDFYKEQLEAYKAKEGFMTYDDLIHRMHQIVISGEGAELRRVIREMFPFVFVDEFQDTDPCQFKIFSRIFNEEIPDDDRDRHGFFMIGDPKQAIYSFRGGDLHAYLNAVRQVQEGQGRCFSLTRNFRSGEKFIGALNGFYGQWQNPFEIPDIQLEHILHGNEKNNLYRGNQVDGQPLQFVPLDNVDAVLDWTVNKVLDLLSNQRYFIGHEANPENNVPGEKKAVTASDIAILFPTKAQGAKLEEMLNQKGIDTIWLSESDIFQKPEAKTLWRFLDMLYGGARMSDMVAVLSDGLFMCTAKELLKFQQEERQDGNAEELPCVRAQRYFKDLRKIWESKGVYAMFQKFLYESNGKGRQWLCKIREEDDHGIVDRFQDESSLAKHIIQTDKVNGRYIFGRIRQLVDKLHRVEQKRHLTPGRLLAYLQGMVNQDKELEDSGMEHNVQRNTDKPAVRLLTLHHSKGLDFPIVLLPHVVSHENKKLKRLFHDAQQRRSVDMVEEHSGECDQEAFQEKLRLLYVGLTRAKFACYAPYKANKKLTGIPARLAQLPNFSDFQVDAELAAGDWRGGDEVEPSTQARDFDGKSVWDWQVGSFSGFKGSFHNDELPEVAVVEPANGGDDEQTEEDEAENNPSSSGTPNDLPGDDEQEAIFKFAAGKEAGTVWHEIFEKMDFQPDALEIGECFDEEKEIALVTQLPRQSLYQAIRRCKEEDDEAQKRDIAFARMLKGVLCNPMGPAGETFMLKDIPQERRASELRFLYVLKNDMTLNDIKECLEQHGIPTGDWAETAESGRRDWALTGSIDLLCQAEGGKYYVIDWKTNGLNRTMGDFTREGMEREINKKLYSLQYLLYTVAFWHFLKERQGIELTEENYRKHFGGVLYLFVRGMAAPLKTMSETEQQMCQARGIYYELPPFNLVCELKELLDIRSKG